VQLTPVCRALAIAAALAANAARAEPARLVFEAAPGGFAARGAAWSASLAADGATFLLALPTPDRDGRDAAPARVRVRVAGADPRASLRGEAPLASTSSVRIGSDPARWRSGVPNFARVRAAGVRPGLDVVYRGDPARLETDYELAPGADPAALALVFEGAEALRVDPNGELVVHSGRSELRESRPVAYQLDGAGRRPVDARFEVVGPDRVRLALGRYDRSRTLVIDPVLSYSTPLGGAGLDAGSRVAADPLGNTYVTGRTVSLDWPTRAPLQPGYGGGVYDAFVAKLDAQGGLVWSTYVGGGGDDRGVDVDVDAQGYVYVVGRTDSPDLPVVRALQPALAGDTDAFLGKLRPDGSAFVYLTYFGASGRDEPRAVASDARGRLVAAGLTSSPDLPTASPIQPAYGGGDSDAWVGVVSPFGDRLEFATWLGGALADEAAGVAVDAQGRPVVAGSTDSADFPTANAVQPARAGLSDAFVAKLDPAAHALVFSTYLGGSGNGAAGDETGADVALDASGAVYVAGRTRSADFPVASAAQPALRGTEDAFVAKLAAAGAPVVYATYLGGTGTDEARAIAVDPAARLAFVTGRTASPDFPVVGAVQAGFGGVADAFESVLAADGRSLVESTYLGGGDADEGTGIALDAQSDSFVTGATASGNFPTAHAAQPAHAGDSDAFAAKLLHSAEIAVRLAPPASPGAGPRLSVELANGSQSPKLVEMKVWLEGPGLAPVSLTGTSAPRVSLAPGATIALITDRVLPATLAFPGATVGARLLDGNDGRVLSESTCKAVPCH
jgi:hypothetical protein